MDFFTGVAVALGLAGVLRLAGFSAAGAVARDVPEREAGLLADGLADGSARVVAGTFLVPVGAVPDAVDQVVL